MKVKKKKLPFKVIEEINEAASEEFDRTLSVVQNLISQVVLSAPEHPDTLDVEGSEVPEKVEKSLAQRERNEKRRTCFGDYGELPSYMAPMVAFARKVDWETFEKIATSDILPAYEELKAEADKLKESADRASQSQTHANQVLSKSLREKSEALMQKALVKQNAAITVWKDTVAMSEKMAEEDGTPFLKYTHQEFFTLANGNKLDP